MNKLGIPVLLAVLGLCIALPAGALAQAQSPQPAIFSGTVTLDGAPVADGTVITAIIDGIEAASTTTTGGEYALLVAQSPGRSFTDKQITFKVGGVTTSNSAVWQPGGGGVLHLTATSVAARISWPAVFAGTVTSDGRPADDGTQVSAMIGEVVVATATVTGGRYALMIAQPPGQSYAGKTITFRVGSGPALETARWQADGGELNLTAAPEAVTPADAFADVIGADNNLRRVWHFDPSMQDIAPDYGWFLYDPRPVYSLANNIAFIQPGKFYMVSIHREQPQAALGGRVMHLYAGWNPVTWP